VSGVQVVFAGAKGRSFEYGGRRRCVTTCCLKCECQWSNPSADRLTLYHQDLSVASQIAPPTDIVCSESHQRVLIFFICSLVKQAEEHFSGLSFVIKRLYCNNFGGSSSWDLLVLEVTLSQVTWGIERWD